MLEDAAKGGKLEKAANVTGGALEKGGEKAHELLNKAPNSRSTAPGLGKAAETAGEKIAHELAHLARGDATAAARSARFVEALEQAVERNGRRVRGPLGAWARFLPARSVMADRARGTRTRRHGPTGVPPRSPVAVAAASALVKVAVVQPLFREVLAAYDPNDVRSN